MTQSDIIAATAQWVEGKMSGEATGHDWWHVQRVWKNAVKICKNEGGDLFVIEMAALLHDMGDHKFHGGIDKTYETAMYWLDQFTEITSTNKHHIADICHLLSYKGAGVSTDMPTPEGKIVQDADRLDALGAIGIARAFAYGGKKNRMIHHPGASPTLHQSFEEYQSSQSTTIQHFYEKLLLLEDRMQTETGRMHAKQRTLFMEDFLKNFFAEWEGI
jgi:uncharacterized protein